MLAFRFLQYWGRIGSENNMTSCHRPICRKEGVLLDYSTDGGTFQGWKPCLAADSQIPSIAPQKSLCKALLTWQCKQWKSQRESWRPWLHSSHYTFYICNFCAIQNLPEKGKERNHILKKTPSLWVKTIITKHSWSLIINDTIKK